MEWASQQGSGGARLASYNLVWTCEDTRVEDSLSVEVKNTSGNTHKVRNTVLDKS